MRHGLTVLWMVIWSVTSAVAQVSIGIGLPGVSIEINLPDYPDLVRVPGYRVCYGSTTGFTSSTMACTGSIREMTGTPAPGTAGLGHA